MVHIKRIALDILKPHKPNALDFTTAIAEKVPGSKIRLTVTAMDEKTETVLLIIEGEQVQFNVIEPPKEPLVPSSPDRPRLNLGVLLGGIAAGITISSSGPMTGSFT